MSVCPYVRDRTLPGFLYAFGVPGVPLVKIGYTHNVRKREEQLQDMQRLGEMLHVVRLDTIQQAMEAETAAHRLMAPFRCKQVAGRRNSGRREWYTAEPALAIEAIKRAGGAKP